MSRSGLDERLERVKALLCEVRHVAVATVNEDGSPHNSPVFAALDDQLRVYWASRPDTAHSRNIERTGQAFISVFDSIGEGGGLYIRATVHPLGSHELGEGLEAFNAAGARCGRDQVGPELFIDTHQYLYCAEPEQAWVNLSERDDAGHIIRDTRVEITTADLINGAPGAR